MENVVTNFDPERTAMYISRDRLNKVIPKALRTRADPIKIPPKPSRSHFDTNPTRNLRANYAQTPSRGSPQEVDFNSIWQLQNARHRRKGNDSQKDTNQQRH